MAVSLKQPNCFFLYGKNSCSETGCFLLFYYKFSVRNSIELKARYNDNKVRGRCMSTRFHFYQSVSLNCGQNDIRNLEQFHLPFMWGNLQTLFRAGNFGNDFSIHRYRIQLSSQLDWMQRAIFSSSENDIFLKFQLMMSFCSSTDSYIYTMVAYVIRCMTHSKLILKSIEYTQHLKQGRKGKYEIFKEHN